MYVGICPSGCFTHYTLRLHLPELLSGLETFIIRNGKHTKEAFAASKVVVSNGRIIFLTSCIEYVNLNFFAIQNDLYAYIENRIVRN